MNTKRGGPRSAPSIPRWADAFPYVNGGLFSGSMDVPRFSKIARSYLLHIGNLDWTKINPDIFGSMIQAVAEDEERGALGMHYTSVPNILKVLNPLFLDDLRAQAGGGGRQPPQACSTCASAWRGSGSSIRPAAPATSLSSPTRRCGRSRPRSTSGAASRTGAAKFRSPTFAASSCATSRPRSRAWRSIIAEYQCDVLYRGQKLALAEFLPLDAENWITCGNALRLDWLSICPPTGTGVKLQADDLFGTPLDQAQIDFENEGGETYICGNPPYQGQQVSRLRSRRQICEAIFDGRTSNHGSRSTTLLAGS